MLMWQNALWFTGILDVLFFISYNVGAQ